MASSFANLNYGGLAVPNLRSRFPDEIIVDFGDLGIPSRSLYFGRSSWTIMSQPVLVLMTMGL